MAIQDSNITLIGAQASIFGIAIVPQSDGKISIEVHGKTKDSGGKEVQLVAAVLKVDPGQIAAVDNLIARALTELRKANALEV